MKSETEKVFLIFNTAQIGDILINNALVQNIKLKYADAKIVFVVSPKMVEVAKFQKDVDDVVILDKKKIKNPINFINFLIKFPYKKIFASFVLYSNERNLILSKLLGAKHIVSHSTNFFKNLHSKEKFERHNYEHAKDESCALLEPLVENVELNLPIRYCPQNDLSVFLSGIKDKFSTKNLIAICPTSNAEFKDMPLQFTKDLIDKIYEEGKLSIITGAGIIAQNYAQELEKTHCEKFINLVDKTSIVDLANLLKQVAKGLISVDTGTLHLANAVECPVVDVFYNPYVAKMWAPDEKLYKAKTFIEDRNNIKTSPKELIEELYKLMT